MKPSFFPRLLSFTIAFWIGATATIFLLTLVKYVCLFHSHFSVWFFSMVRFDVFPVSLAEMIHSPFLGLLYALAGKRHPTLPAVIRFSVACGAVSYAVAEAVNLASFGGWSFSPWLQQPLAEHIILGLPVVLIVLSHWRAR